MLPETACPTMQDADHPHEPPRKLVTLLTEIPSLTSPSVVLAWKDLTWEISEGGCVVPDTIIVNSTFPGRSRRTGRRRPLEEWLLRRGRLGGRSRFPWFRLFRYAQTLTYRRSYWGQTGSSPPAAYPRSYRCGRRCYRAYLPPPRCKRANHSVAYRPAAHL